MYEIVSIQAKVLKSIFHTVKKMFSLFKKNCVIFKSIKCCCNYNKEVGSSISDQNHLPDLAIPAFSSVETFRCQGRTATSALFKGLTLNNKPSPLAFTRGVSGLCLRLSLLWSIHFFCLPPCNVYTLVQNCFILELKCTPTTKAISCVLFKNCQYNNYSSCFLVLLVATATLVGSNTNIAKRTSQSESNNSNIR